MAEAKRTMVRREVTTMVEETQVILTLSLEEAIALYSLVGRVGGSSNIARPQLDKTFDALALLGFTDAKCQKYRDDLSANCRIY